MSVTIPKLTEQEIENYIGSKSFDKGKQYFNKKAIFDTRKVAMTLKANCEGSYETAYRLRVTFSCS